MAGADALALEILGHRGARGLAPENTLAGFARALEIGVTGFELDCAITRDDVVVIYHDALLNPDMTRGPDGAWLPAAGPPLRDLTWRELQSYDVGRIRPGSDYNRRFPDQSPVDGTRIPRLADLFALVQGSGDRSSRFYLEIKISPHAPERTTDPDDFARKVIDVVREHGMAARSCVLSFDWRALAATRRHAPGVPTVHLTAQQRWQDNVLARDGASPWTAPLHVSRFDGSLPRIIVAAGGYAWAPYHEELTAPQVAEAHALGLKIVPWTVNETGDMRRMIELGVDGIISDYPDRLRTVAGAAGIRLPRRLPSALPAARR